MIDQTARFHICQTFPNRLKGTNHMTGTFHIFLPPFCELLQKGLLVMYTQSGTVGIEAN